MCGCCCAFVMAIEILIPGAGSEVKADLKNDPLPFLRKRNPFLPALFPANPGQLVPTVFASHSNSKHQVNVCIVSFVPADLFHKNSASLESEVQDGRARLSANKAPASQRQFLQRNYMVPTSNFHVLAHVRQSWMQWDRVARGS